MKKLLIISIAFFSIASVAWKKKGMPKKFPVTKTDAEWKKQLTADQFAVARKAGTERAFSGTYWDNHKKGTYSCICCNQLLFSSATKFESGTGWPSFVKPAAANMVEIRTDADGERDEVIEKSTGLHLGHVFDDGPVTRGGKRFCMTSGTLKFIKK